MPHVRPRPAGRGEDFRTDTESDHLTVPEPTEESPESRQPSTDGHSTEPAAEPAGAAEAKETTEAASEQLPEDELPEWEPLTPEDVEDEAIRGDFVLRWAAVLLAFLLACTAIADSRALVHVRSGEYLLSHGVLPPATDVFSSTAGDRPWINLSWLFDILTAVTWKIGGDMGLSLLRAALVAGAFGLLVHISLRNVSTWWGSILAALALLAAWPQLTVEPRTITLLGLATELWLLHLWQRTQSPRPLMAIAGLLLVWSNCDPRAFLGLYLLVLFAGGETIASLRTGGDPEATDTAESSPGSGTGRLWLAVAGGLVAMLINPFGWHSLLSPVSLYSLEYPKLKSLYQVSAAAEHVPWSSMLSADFWQYLHAWSIAGLLVVLAAAVSLVLNRRRASPGWVLAWLGFTALAVMVVHELAAAAVVAMVVCVLNSQEWYRHRFRQTYSVERSELVFSRGGRAATVLAMTCLAWLAISGRMVTPDGRRVGLGWSDRLEADLLALEDELGESYDDRPFNFLLRQGDILIWIGRKPFIDSRLKLYLSSREDENLVELHNRVRHALRQRRENDPLSGQQKVWKDVFDQYEITHVIPRLAGRRPDYFTYLDLLRSPDWQLTQLGAASATFYRRDTGDKALAEWLTGHQVQFVDEAFRDEVEEPAERLDWPRPRTGYQRLLQADATTESNSIQLAQHYERHLEIAATGQIVIPPQLGAAIAHLAIRHANAGLAEDASNPVGYEVLAGAYVYLGLLESGISGRGPGGYDDTRRSRQAMHNLFMADILEPNNPETLRRLLEGCVSRGRYDVALRTLNRLVDLLSQRTDLPTVHQELLDNSENTRERLEGAISQIRSRIDELKQKDVPGIVVAQQSWQNGLVLDGLTALEAFLQENPEAAAAPPIQILHATMLMDSGDPERAVELVTQAQAAANQMPPGVQWREQAALALLAQADCDGAAKLWSQEAEQMEQQRMIQLLQTLPLVTSPRAWPLQQTAGGAQALYSIPRQIAGHLLDVALCHLESGRHQAAEAALRKLLEISPDSPLRPLAGFYLYQLTGEVIDVGSPANQIPVEADMFTTDETPPVAPRETTSTPSPQKKPASQSEQDTSTENPAGRKPVVAPRPPAGQP